VNTFTNADWAAILPAAVVGAGALLVLFIDLVARGHAKRYVSLGLGILIAIVGGYFAAKQYGTNYSAFSGGFVVGGFASVFQEIVIVALAGSLALYGAIGSEDRIAGATALMLWAAAGAMLMAGAANLMTIFLGLELLSLALYCLCGLSDRGAARESALKYLILSSTASGFMIFGMALLFGASGSVQLADIANPALAHSPLLWMGAAFFFVGIAFKLSLVPFHAWSPDVYEGAPLPVTAFMSVATKAGTLAVLARFIYAALPPGIGDRLLLPIWIVAGISMIAGNVGMLAQHDLKRLLAYSGIAQVGYILTALAGSTALGLRYAIYYLAAYTLMNLGAFAVAAVLSSDAEEGSRLATYRGLGQRKPLLAAAMTVFLLALAGMPPTAGFLGKILILETGAASGYWWLGALLIVGTAISLFAYAKIIRAMYTPRDTAERTGAAGHEASGAVPLAWASVAICAVLVVAMAFYPLTPSAVLPLVR